MSIPSEQPTGFESESGIWHTPFKVHSYDVDFRQRATPEAICRAFLEAAWNHAEHLGFGYQALASQNKLWVLSRLLVLIEDYPKWGEQLQLTTWPRGVSGLFALRDFELCDSQSRSRVTGSSSWLVLDAATHRPQRMDKMALEIPIRVTRRAAGREPIKISQIEHAQRGPAIPVRYSDIDVNRHVNSARYISWLLDSYSEDFHQAHSLHSVELNYTGETRWTDTVWITTDQRRPLEFAHSIAREDQSEVCRAQFHWASDSKEPANLKPQAIVS